jgi:hypothetical protein
MGGEGPFAEAGIVTTSEDRRSINDMISLTQERTAIVTVQAFPAVNRQGDVPTASS